MTKKVLIVDDEPHLRFLLEQTLEDFEDYSVRIESVENGQLALDSISEEKPDLMFLDVMMPLVNGFDVCTRVKSNPNTADIYIVLLTAKGQEMDRIKGQEVGADLYLTKPFDPDEIVEITSEQLKIKLDI
tara:strand:+ start:63 stop:452 length:390 start_codon:yes stop_codon:yes gene_type:complete